MNYQVVWLSGAEGQLAAVWVAAADRAAVTSASEWFERQLRQTPDRLGKQEFDTVRSATHGPLGIEFEVDDPSGRVVVLSVWDVDRGPADPTGH
ncbi:MAG: hypothetical protein ACRC7O_09175 [Fimbriiglobus sp.]